ncbi:MAG: NAD(P)-dependent oxidoreductase [Desulfobacteraceae bacterium]|nr:NAD(P)-dependent oxidoreductase [Desulfobacteraceae bacterium]
MDLMKIGWIGTGVMGAAMCGHMIKAGHELFIHNRSKSKADQLLKSGAHWCETPKAVARECRIVFSIVGYPQDVRQVILGPDGVIAGAGPGTLIVDMTTSSPALAMEIHEQANKKGSSALDAPVSGGDVGAREATLAIMVGGNKTDFERGRQLLGILGKNIVHMGPPGSGQHTKMCNQILVAGTMIGVVESLLYAQRNGMELNTVIDVIGSGAASSWAINHLGRRIAAHDYNPGFFIKHFVKDMGIALEECRRMNLSLPGLALVQQLYLAAMAQGEQNMGTQALYKILARMNDLDSL